MSRKGFEDALLGGELALEMQLPVKDAEPDSEIEIRTGRPKEFRDFVGRILKATELDITSSARVVRDSNISPSKRIGLVQVSKPEKLLVDAIAEKQSRVFVEKVVEAITASRYSIDMALLTSYAKSRGVLEEVLRELAEAKESGFP